MELMTIIVGIIYFIAGFGVLRSDLWRCQREELGSVKLALFMQGIFILFIFIGGSLFFNQQIYEFIENTLWQSFLLVGVLFHAISTLMVVHIFNTKRFATNRRGKDVSGTPTRNNGCVESSG